MPRRSCSRSAFALDKEPASFKVLRTFCEVDIVAYCSPNVYIAETVHEMHVGINVLGTLTESAVQHNTAALA
jgi:hypothetical protein